MKLHEIQTITPKDFKPREVHQGIGNLGREWRKARERSPHHTTLGKGAFGTAYSSEKDPGTAEKISNEPMSTWNDAYYKYLNMLAHNERMQHNPFFPKIYSFKAWKDPDSDNRIIYDVKMEKLHPLDSLSMEQIKAMGESLFSNFYQMVKHFKKYHMYRGVSSKASVEDREHNAEQLKGIMIYAIARNLHTAIRYGRIVTYITNPLLRQALTLIRGLLIGKEGASADLHIHNIMARLGPGGAQLVITDPVS